MYYYYRRQTKLVVGVLILAGLVYGGIKGWMYYNVTRAMDQLSVSAIGHADIAYGAIDTELSGAVQVRELSVLPRGASAPVRIELARVSGPGLGFFLWGQRDDQPPPRMRLDLSGIEIGLDAGLLAALATDAGAGAATGVDSCGPSQGPDPALLRELGLQALRMDAVMAYDFDAIERRLDAQLELDVHQIERVQAELQLADVSPAAITDGIAAGPNAIPTLAAMSVDVRVEPEFGRRYLAACAARRGQTPEDFRQALVADTLANLSRSGLQLGPGLSQALQTFHRDWGDLRVSAQPAAPLNLMALMFTPPDDWQRQLGVRVSVNRVPVQDLSFALRPPNAHDLAVMMGQEPPPPAAAPQDRYRYVYRDVPVSRLAEHVGAEVRLHLRDEQPTRAGVLVAVAGNEVRVEQRLLGGKITAHVALQNVGRLEVRQLEKIPAQ